MLQGLQLSAFPSSSPQAELHYYRTYCGDTCVLQREMKVKITTYSEDVNQTPFFFFLLLASQSWATTEEGEREEQDGRSALADFKPSQPPPALQMQDLKHLPDGCWLLIRTVSSQRPAGKPAGSLELASKSLPSFLERVT